MWRAFKLIHPLRAAAEPCAREYCSWSFRSASAAHPTQVLAFNTLKLSNSAGRNTDLNLPTLWRRFAYTDSRLGLGPTGKIVLGTLLVGSGLYYVNSIETIPYTGRRHAILFVSKAQEKALGQAMFKQTLQEAIMQGNLLPPHHPYVRVVEQVGRRVAAVAVDDAGGGYHQHMKNMEWEFAVIAGNQPNAFVVPGGKVVVFSALLDMLQSQDELAAVLAHETGHVLARHHAERMSTLNVFSLIKFLVYAFVGISVPSAAMVLGVFLPYSRLAEHEADTIGLKLMSRACFDPGAAPTMLSKLHHKEHEMESKSNMRVPGFLRTHPLTEERVTKVRDQLPEAYKVYKQAGCGAVSDFTTSFQTFSPGYS